MDCDTAIRDDTDSEGILEREGLSMRRLIVLVALVAAVVGAAVTLCSDPPARTAAGKGTLKLANEKLAMELRLSRTQKVIVKPKKGAKMPAGTYNPIGFTLLTQDKRKKTWKLESSRNLGQLRTITIEEDKETVLECGPKLTLRSATMQYQRRGVKYVSIGISLSDSAGVHYSSSVRVGSRRAPAPKFRIIDRDEKVLASGAFSYG